MFDSGHIEAAILCIGVISSYRYRKYSQQRYQRDRKTIFALMPGSSVALENRG